MIAAPDHYEHAVVSDAEQLARDADALVSALTDGVPDQTVSVRVALAAQRGERWASWGCAVLSVLVQRNHCVIVLTAARLPWWVYVRAAVCFAAVALLLALILESVF